VDAAIAGGATRYIQESIAFMYGDHGDEWIDEDTPLETIAFGDALKAAEAEALRFTDSGGSGVVMRFGQFYAPEAAHTVTMNKAAKRRVAPVIGPKESYVSMIAADDAASAVVAALHAPAGTYNVTEDEPLTRYEFGQAVAAALGVKPPHYLPVAVGKVAGEKGRFYMRSQRVSNRRFQEAAGWAPRYASAKDGWAAVVASHA
jgi:nucleoside-diphosphate-sugar epimerase